MTGFTGIFWDLVEATRDAFGREDGFDASGPSVFAEEYLPAEIADGLTHAEAETAAERFRRAGGTVLVVRSSELPDVRHRAREYWSQRTGGDTCFTEIDGVVTWMSPARARDLLRDRMSGTTVREKEKALNDEHADLEEVETLRLALLEAYPERCFTISHDLCSVMTFWQSECGSEDVELRYSKPEFVTWCAVCLDTVRHDPDPHLDEYVPGLQWGKCSQCGSQQPVQTCEQRTYVNPKRHVPGEPPEGK